LFIHISRSPSKSMIIELDFNGILLIVKAGFETETAIAGAK